jgi:hypothetical protein
MSSPQPQIRDRYRGRDVDRSSVGTSHTTTNRRQYQRQSQLLLLAVAIFCLVMGAAQLGTAVYTKDGNFEQVWTGLWSSETCPTGQEGTSLCVTTDLPSGQCQAAEDRQRTLQAFGILLFLSLIVTSILAVVDVARSEMLPPLLTVVFLAIVMVASLIQWAVIAGTYHMSLCDSRSMSTSGYRMSASFALDMCIWIASLFALVAVVTLRYFLGLGLS